MTTAGVDRVLSGARAGGDAVLTLIRPRPGWRWPDVAELWRYRELLGFLVWRDVKARYKQTVMGAAWAVIQPVGTMVVFSVVFGKFAGIPSDGVPYPVFVYAGLLPWLLLANSVSQAGLSLVTHANLVSKVYFPRLFIPAASIGVGLVDFALSFVVYMGILIWYAHWPGPGVLLLPVLLLLTVVTALGVGLLLAGLTVIYRDFRHAIPFLVQVWLYLSPVVYPVALVPPAYRWIMWLNPMTGIIGGFRSALLDQPLEAGGLAAAAGMAVLLLIAGVASFGRCERRFADVV